MQEYRIFTIGPDGHFAGVPKIVKFSDDNEAIEKAIPMANGADIEIWNLERRIMRLPGNSPRAQPVKISAARTKRNRISRTCIGSLEGEFPASHPRASPSKSLA
jgi:hypothetical protein